MKKYDDSKQNLKNVTVNLFENEEKPKSGKNKIEIE